MESGQPVYGFRQSPRPVGQRTSFHRSVHPFGWRRSHLVHRTVDQIRPYQLFVFSSSMRSIERTLEIPVVDSIRPIGCCIGRFVPSRILRQRQIHVGIGQCKS